jgi:hypothetical protein
VGGGSILADVMVQAQIPDIVIIDQSVDSRHRIALNELTCPWDTDAKRAEEQKTSRYAVLKTALSNEGWNCSLYMIEVGARSHILKSVKDRLRSLFLAWVPAGHRSAIGQMMKDVRRISFVCSFSIIQACNDPVWSSPRLRHSTHRWGADGSVNRGSFGTPSPYPPLPPQGVGQFFVPRGRSGL